MTIKAIETEYNGYRFRSRLEARWAVFFDSLGIPWVYEPEGINVDGVNYLPDFYLPDCKQFFEVKGLMTDIDMNKVQALISAGYSVTIGYDDGKFVACDRWEDKEKAFYSLCEGGQSSLCKCRECGKYWFMGTTGMWECQCCGHYDGDHGFNQVMSYEAWGDYERADTKLWDVARQARFEHGEKLATERRAREEASRKRLLEIKEQKKAQEWKDRQIRGYASREIFKRDFLFGGSENMCELGPLRKAVCDYTDSLLEGGVVAHLGVHNMQYELGRAHALLIQELFREGYDSDEISKIIPVPLHTIEKSKDRIVDFRKVEYLAWGPAMEAVHKYIANLEK